LLRCTSQQLALNVSADMSALPPLLEHEPTMRQHRNASNDRTAVLQ
jgi:hypothetical protein